MSLRNFGELNYAMGYHVGQSYLNESLHETKNLFQDYLRTIRSNRILALEFAIYANLEGKQINEESQAYRYIDEHIQLLEGYTNKQIDEANKELERFTNICENHQVPAAKQELYQGIDALIRESRSNSVQAIDRLHDAISTVREHLSKEKTHSATLQTERADTANAEDKFEKSISVFNSKYNNLTEGEKEIIIKMTSSDEQTQKELFEGIKNENKKLLESQIGDDRESNYQIYECLYKIDKMAFNESTLMGDISKLLTLKQDIIEDE